MVGLFYVLKFAASSLDQLNEEPLPVSSRIIREALRRRRIVIINNSLGYNLDIVRTRLCDGWNTYIILEQQQSSPGKSTMIALLKAQKKRNKSIGSERVKGFKP